MSKITENSWSRIKFASTVEIVGWIVFLLLLYINDWQWTKNAIVAAITLVILIFVLGITIGRQLERPRPKS